MFKIDGLTDWIEMAETRSGTESQNSKDVFSLAGFADTLTGEGVYSGLYRIEAEDKVDSAKIRFRLVKSISSESESLKNYMAYSEIFHHLCPDSVRLSLCAVDSAEGNLTIFDASVPQVVDLTDTSQISARTGPGYLYWYLFQSAGTKAIFAGKAGKWVKLKLTETDFAWIEEEKVKFLPRGTSPPFSRVTYLRTNQTEGGVKVTFSMSQRLPFRIQQTSQPSALTVDIFYATADAGFTRYDSKDKIIKQLNWSQPAEDHFQAQILFGPNQQWGYKAYYEGASLVLEIKSEPELGSKLDGLTVMVDPGHSLDPGSTGPTSLKEKDVNLSIAKKLRDILRKHGANVVMTRSGDDNVPLYDRPKLAEEKKADIFVSVHNNAHPDGVNPFTNTGTSVYYYHPQSQRLAEYVHQEMVQHLEIGDQGLYAGNFAVLRPTGYLSILVECAFIIHPEQEILLREEEFQEKIAKAIYQGLEEFLKELK
jgi:N-acetylmuramoyl-L-alanine amidase